MDWLAALDDLLCQRFWCCTKCGEATTTVYVGVCELAHQRSIAYCVCARCRGNDGGDAAVRPVLEQRYAVERRVP
jgi:hypothetical protein